MFALLYQYLIENGEVYLQGIGTMQMIAQPAAYDVASQQLLPPKHVVKVLPVSETPALQPFIAFIARQLNLTEEDAFNLYNQYCKQLQGQLAVKKSVALDPFGVLRVLPDGNYDFVMAPELENYRQPVPAVRVIRKNAEHSMMVGTTETTSTAMRELLEVHPVATKKSKWWIAAALISLAAIALIVLKKMAYL